MIPPKNPQGKGGYRMERRLQVGNVFFDKILKQYLFRKDPESAHCWTIKKLKYMQSHFLPVIRYFFQNPCVNGFKNNVNVGGCVWRNRLGLAAGFDKDGELTALFDALGLGSMEIGTGTPEPQVGNERPRVFRHEKARAIENRYGFNSVGIQVVVQNLLAASRRHSPRAPIGVSIGKNKVTPDEHAVDDYVLAYRALKPVLLSSYIKFVQLNISSPNTPGLRNQFNRLGEFLAEFCERTENTVSWPVPLYLKVPPDGITQEQYARIVETAAKYGVSAIEATNTTTNPKFKEAYGIPTTRGGGLSGEPLRLVTDAVLAMLDPAAKQHHIDLIGVGGILSGEHALEKITHGAKAVQVYTGLVYCGPRLIHEILETLATR